MTWPDPDGEPSGPVSGAAGPGGATNLVLERTAVSGPRPSAAPIRASHQFEVVEVPPIDRPASRSPLRTATLVVGVVAVLAALALVELTQPDAATTDEAVRVTSVAVVGAFAIAQALFASWTHRKRLTVDVLRSNSFQRPGWSGWWAMSWMLVPIALGAVILAMLASDVHVAWTGSFSVLLVVARIAMLQGLATNMARVVRDARRWTTLRGVAIGVGDLLMVQVVLNAVVDPTPRRGDLVVAASWAAAILVLVAMFDQVYLKRCERWILEWWDHRYGMTEQRVLDALCHARQPVSLAPTDFAARRLAWLVPLRWAVVIAYWAAAAAALFGGWTVWTLRDELTLTSDFPAALERLDEASLAFAAAMLTMWAAHALWCVAAAWNARRCTLDAPPASGVAVLLLLGPGLLVAAIAWPSDERALFISLAMLANLVCWGFSFSAVAQIAQALGRSSRHVAGWATVVAMHWLLGFAARPLQLLGDDVVLVRVSVVLLVIDACIFLVASRRAAEAMRDVELAARGFEQVRRVRVRQRRGAIDLATLSPTT